MTESQEQAIRSTEAWVQDWVIKHQLCPFARQPMQQGSVRFSASKAVALEPALEALGQELDYFHAHPECDTTLLVYSQGFRDFEQYLDLLELGNALIAELGLETDYQLASFHPDYCFEGAAVNDPSNHTNRSPFPTLHLLRQAQLTQALQHYSNPEQIFERNMALMQRLFK